MHLGKGPSIAGLLPLQGPAAPTCRLPGSNISRFLAHCNHSVNALQPLASSSAVRHLCRRPQASPSESSSLGGPRRAPAGAALAMANTSARSSANRQACRPAAGRLLGPARSCQPCRATSRLRRDPNAFVGRCVAAACKLGAAAVGGAAYRRHTFSVAFATNGFLPCHHPSFPAGYISFENFPYI